jgi:hypothetical protein
MTRAPMKARLLSTILAVFGAVDLRAEEMAVPLKDAPGREAVESNCASCHSLDYSLINSPFLDRKGWEAEVNKMVKVFGAPIPAADTTTIVDYLTRNYGAGG